MPERAIHLQETAKKTKPIFSKVMFWDVDFEKLDYDRHPNFIIERVFERGDIEDIRQCRRYYGDEKVREALTQAKWMRKDIVYLAMAVLNNKKEDYRCYAIAQLDPQHWCY
ncbi:MAG: hypothetical protein LBK18_02185 [Prevotellaceae bacterium]|nr:hypothetical protein [Prevotellaceae bacterium]